MTVLSIRLPERLEAELSEESSLAGQSRSLIARTALEQFLADRRRDRFLAQLTRAASAINAGEAVALAEEALPFDDEALALTEKRRQVNDPPIDNSRA